MAPRTPPPSIPTVAEVLKHPAFPTAIWNLEPDRKGLALVAEGRGGPIKISWEIRTCYSDPMRTFDPAEAEVD